MLIKRGSDVWMDAAAVIRIDVQAHHNVIVVTTSDGASHSVGADYGKGVYATADRLVAEINAALK